MSSPAEAKSRGGGVAIGIGAAVLGAVIINEALKNGAQAKPSQPERRARPPRRERDEDDEPKQQTRSVKPPKSDESKQVDNDQPRRGVKPQPDKDPDENAPEKQVDKQARKQPAPDLPTFPERPRPSIYQLPQRPTINAQGNALSPDSATLALISSPAERLKAVLGGPATASAIIPVILAQRFGKPEVASVDQVRALAGDAYATSGLPAIVAATPQGSPFAREEKVHALIIAEAARTLEAMPRTRLDNVSSFDVVITLKGIMDDAAVAVQQQTRDAMEAAQLTRASDDLIGAINDVLSRGQSAGGLETTVLDRGKMLMAGLETQLLGTIERDVPTSPARVATVLGMRRQLVKCVSLRLPTLMDEQAANGGLHRAAVRSAGEAKVMFSESIVEDIRISCIPMLGPIRKTSGQQAERQIVPPGEGNTRAQPAALSPAR